MIQNDVEVGKAINEYFDFISQKINLQEIGFNEQVLGKALDLETDKLYNTLLNYNLNNEEINKLLQARVSKLIDKD